MTHIYFVRHAEPDHDWEDDRTRPLSKAGKADSRKVTLFFKDVHIDRFISSPYVRSYDTIKESAAEHGMDIATDERLREREHIPGGNTMETIKKRWADFDYHEEGGESLCMVQRRNMAALLEILDSCKDQSIVIGTHGTALSTILHYFDPGYGFEGFHRMMDYMPYIIRLDFDGICCTAKEEILIVEKEFLKNSFSRQGRS